VSPSSVVVVVMSCRRLLVGQVRWVRRCSPMDGDEQRMCRPPRSM
jgi:hypothetical protein